MKKRAEKALKGFAGASEGKAGGGFRTIEEIKGGFVEVHARATLRPKKEVTLEVAPRTKRPLGASWAVGGKATPAQFYGGEQVINPVPTEPDSVHVAAFVRDFDVQKHPSWNAVKKDHPKASLFVTECSPDSVEIESGGKFSTRAQLLVDVPVKYPDGFEVEGSMTVPAFVTGTLKNNGDVVIKEFRLSMDHPA
ncbi:hypothetical protein [Microvirga sp. VF16]|uniref:hypothetical protein n=1 Tax=Microvirga sp. VF16 TaxID=2807101 RepID=UPI00193D034B|nr:hypothetical protein [Microvirga sp. VF16]QRM34879.1 hypothetical protein JO965_42215 [Microvirga sp. VF16]